MDSFNPYKIDNSSGTLWEFPILSGGGYFRLLPYSFIKRKIKQLNKNGCPAVIYLHPWELDPQQPRIKVGWISGFRHYINISKTEAKLERLLSDFKFTAIKDIMLSRKQDAMWAES